MKLFYWFAGLFTEWNLFEYFPVVTMASFIHHLAHKITIVYHQGRVIQNVWDVAPHFNFS